MKKLTIKKNTAAGILAGIMLTGCATVNDQQNTEAPDPSYEPAENENTEVYGPAPVGVNDEDDKQNQTTAEAGEYNPSVNINADVYGPPPVENGSSDQQSGENTQP